jgi:hypothetical protein
VEEKIEEQITASPLAEEAMVVLGELWWLFIALAALLVFKETIKSFVTSIMVLRSGTYEVDDVVILEGTPARIVRMGVWKTTFYVYRQVNGGRLFHSTRDVMNEELPQLHIEIPQQRMDQLIPDEFMGKPVGEDD